MQLRLPADLPPSMRGALIVCTYYVRVELNIGSFVKDVRLKVGRGVVWWCGPAGAETSGAASRLDASRPPHPTTHTHTVQVPLIVMAPQPVPTAEAPFFTEPPPFWSPTETLAPQGIDVPSAPPLPAELLQPGACGHGVGEVGWLAGRQARAPTAQPPDDLPRSPLLCRRAVLGAVAEPWPWHGRHACAGGRGGCDASARAAVV